MKTTNATFLQKQLADSIEQEYRLELFEQFEGAITDRDSATQIKVSGDATTLLSNGDVFIIALDDFETEHTITSAPSYSGGKTTIVCSASSFSTSVVGLDVAKKRNISNDILDRGISPIRISTEGETLNSFLADDVTLKLDNDGGTYYNSSGTGLFNSGRVFWVKIFFKLKNDATEFLCFGGTVYLPGIQSQPVNETIEVLCVGHLKELERYPGWKVAEELGAPPSITGVELIQIIEPSTGTDEGIHNLKYKFPDGVDIKGVTINSLSDDTPIGFHVIKFNPPNLWQYDYGSWSQETAGSAGVTLTSKKGHTINVDLPSNFDLVAREDLIYTKSFTAPEADIVGKPSIQFDNGKKEQLKVDFERIILYDGSSYSDITREVCSYDVDEVTVFDAANDVLYFMSPRVFLGIDFDFDTDLVGSLSFAYSRGFDDWGTLSPSDGTSNFSQDGVISFDAPSDWRETNIELGSDVYEGYYCLRITLSSHTSGSAKIKRALRYFRLLAEDGTKLDIKIKLEKLPIEGREDDIIIKEDSSGTMQPCVWQQNLSFQNYLELLLDDAQYTSSHRTLNDLKITASSAIISLYGRPPKSFYDKKVTALCVDTSTSPETIYLGIDDELWKVTEKSGFEFIDQLDLHHKPSGTGSGPEVWTRCSIVRIVIDGNGYLQGMAVGSYEDYYANNPECYRRPAIVFRSTTKSEITEQNQVDSSNLSVFVFMTHCFRMGSYHAIDKNEIGQSSIGSVQCGENIIIPFKQLCFYANPYNAGSQNSVIYDVDALTGNSVSGAGRKYPSALELFYLPPGYFFSSDNLTGDGNEGDLGFCWSIGPTRYKVWEEP